MDIVLQLLILFKFSLPIISTKFLTEDELAKVGLNVLIDCIEKHAEPCHRIIPFEFKEGESVKTL